MEYRQHTSILSEPVLLTENHQRIKNGAGLKRMRLLPLELMRYVPAAGYILFKEGWIQSV